MNKQLLQYYMAQNQDNNTTLSSKLGMSAVSFSSKMNERGRSRFSIKDASRIRALYQLSDKDFINIFFTEKAE